MFSKFVYILPIPQEILMYIQMKCMALDQM